jgi:hypothetical protein
MPNTKYELAEKCIPWKKKTHTHTQINEGKVRNFRTIFGYKYNPVYTAVVFLEIAT